MEVKVYVSGISASKEVKKRQQRVILLLDSAQVNYEQIDITEPGREEERQEVQTLFKVRNENGAALPPQFFLGDTYLGDYEDFNSAVDVDDLLTFLRLENKRIENNNVAITESKPEPEHNENNINSKSVESTRMEEEEEILDDLHGDSKTVEDVHVEEEIHVDEEEEEREIVTENEEIEEVVENEAEITRQELEKEEVADDEEEVEEADDDEEEN